MKIKAPLDFFEDDVRFWTILEKHLRERQEMQRMVLSSVDGEGKPQLRTMVLRALNLNKKALLFYTDARSPKLEQWRVAPFCEALAYSHDDLLQLRFSGQIEILEQGDLFDQAKANLAAHQHNDYNSILAPSSAYDSSQSGRAENLNFALVQVQVEHLEVLALQPKASEHFRWSYQYDKEGQLLNSRRLVP